MARSLNKVELIGNLTRDPELRYTPQGTAVCTFGLATNRQWTTEGGEKKEEAEFHRLVVWNKLAELCAQLLTKGRKIYVEGRLQTRRWTGQDGQERTTTEIVISDMIILDSRMGSAEPKTQEIEVPEDIETEVPMPGETEPQTTKAKATATKTKDDKVKVSSKGPSTSDVKEKTEEKENKDESDDIPF
jgi:single-strand DNA-binding protein